MLYIATVIKIHPGSTKRDAVIESHRSTGDYSAFVGADQNEVIQRALEAKRKWEANGINGPYQVYVGVLSAVAKQPVTYELQEL